MSKSVIARHSETPEEIAETTEKLHTTELIVSAVLRGGVLLSGGVIALGLLLFFFQQHGHMPGDITKIPFTFRPGAIILQALHGSGEAIIMLGLMLLIATPVSRIAVSIITFAFERDWRYVAITTLVLLILIISFTLGKAG
jgi:uncharacterized membrane protein